MTMTTIIDAAFMNLSYNNFYEHDNCFVRRLVTYNCYKMRILRAPLEQGLPRERRGG